MKFALPSLALAGLLSLTSFNAGANPYWDPNSVPQDSPTLESFQVVDASLVQPQAGLSSIRIQINWNSASDAYTLASITRENSGTSALQQRALHQDPHGSYLATLVSSESPNTARFYSSIGTGSDFRLLTRAITFRFPDFQEPLILRMKAENPKTGKMEFVLEETIDPAQAVNLADQGVIRKLFHSATDPEKLLFTVYSEGYTADREAEFWRNVQKLVNSMKSYPFPGLKHLEISGVFHPSKLKLGRARNLGQPVAERDSFLGLYFPFWNDFGRWYHVVYPTREERFRGGVGQAPYDYAIVLVDDGSYWGVGNFKENTAIPARSFQFTYLLMHELGHLFGLNEEYEGGGKTELAFAPGIDEPWSQNITFLKRKDELKWGAFVNPATPLPTPRSEWGRRGGRQYGAYRGGYADTEPRGQSHKPGLRCVMNNKKGFCKICAHAIEKRLQFDLKGVF